jgi:alpha-L-rhamnosidase
MYISNLKINHMDPLPGMNMDPAVISWRQEGNPDRILITVHKDGMPVHSQETGDSSAPLGTKISFPFEPCTAYDVTVRAEKKLYQGENNIASDKTSENTEGESAEESLSAVAQASISLFTGKMTSAWEGKWISAPGDPDLPFSLSKTFIIEKRPKKAVFLWAGLGLSEVSVNGKRAGEEVLTPGYHSYDSHVFTDGLDLTDLLVKGENTIRVDFADGWYRGRIGFGGGYSRVYGDRNCLIGELWCDGSLILKTDNSWQAGPQDVVFSGIYDGEIQDPGYLIHEKTEKSPCILWKPEGTGPLTDRLNPPIEEGQGLSVQKILHTKKEETVLDFGQEITGWMHFTIPKDFPMKKGQALLFSTCEVLQDGCFWNENYRTARSRFAFVYDGKNYGESSWFRPRFTFYGFRYLKIQLLDQPRVLTEEIPVEEPVPGGRLTESCKVLSGEDLTRTLSDSNLLKLNLKAVPVGSKMLQTGFLSSGDRDVNRLFSNILWGQRDNFLDIPTDCPQRDERLGWTGDAQIFSETAFFQFDCGAFFRKYLYDCRAEQRKVDGSLPNTVPRLNRGMVAAFGSSPWADAACVIPWNLYRACGDRELLRECLPGMQSLVDSIRREEEKEGGPHLVKTGFHFGDWLALDNPEPGPFGATDPLFLASAYYFEDTAHTAEAFHILGQEKEAQEYQSLSKEILSAIRDKYFDGDGLCQIRTQTAAAVSIAMGLNPTEEARKKQGDLLAELVHENGDHLNTGFVGTRFLLPALSETGHNGLAVTLLLNRDIPSWLYEVDMGATTIWERWNSLLPDGKPNSDGMNSFNHYCFGSIAGWAARYLGGIREVNPGYRKAEIKPGIDRRLKSFSILQHTPCGTYFCSWICQEDGSVNITVTVPADCTADFETGGLKKTLNAGSWKFRIAMETD